MKSCFFIGHREADERLLPRLELEIERLIQEKMSVISMRADMAALTGLLPLLPSGQNRSTRTLP